MVLRAVLSSRPLGAAVSQRNRPRRRPPARLAAVLAVLMVAAGCQSAAPMSMRRMIAHEAMLDFSGLEPLEPVPDIKMLAPIPLGWEPRPVDATPLYVHHEWRSPSQSNAVGVVYLHLPFPVSARFLVWVAKTRYAQERQEEGLPPARLIAQWSDALGREWVDGENTRYHVRGYALTNGFDAWIVYSGYRLKSPMNPMEIGMAARSVEGTVPMPELATGK